MITKKHTLALTISFSVMGLIAITGCSPAQPKAQQQSVAPNPAQVSKMTPQQSQQVMNDPHVPPQVKAAVTKP